MINITIAFNHDIIDGAPAARFINDFRKKIELGIGILTKGRHRTLFDLTLLLSRDLLVDLLGKFRDSLTQCRSSKCYSGFTGCFF